MKTSQKIAAVAAGLTASLFFAVPFTYAQGTNVAVVDISKIFKENQRFKAAMEDIKKKIQDYETIVKTERKQLQDMGEQLKTYNVGSQEYKTLESQVAKRMADLQVRMQLKRKEFLEQEARVYYHAYNEVVDNIREIAERNNIGLVLRFSGEAIDPQKRESVLAGVNRAVVFQHHNLNITRMVLDRLNRSTPPPTASGGPRVSRPALPPRPGQVRQ